MIGGEERKNSCFGSERVVDKQSIIFCLPASYAHFFDFSNNQSDPVRQQKHPRHPGFAVVSVEDTNRSFSLLNTLKTSEQIELTPGPCRKKKKRDVQTSRVQTDPMLVLLCCVACVKNVARIRMLEITFLFFIRRLKKKIYYEFRYAFTQATLHNAKG